MQAAVQETTQTQEIASDLKDVVINFENFLAETVKNSNTYRQKRELNFLNIKTAVINYLDALKADQTLTAYALELSQSGAKKMGIYLVGQIIFMLNGNEFTLKIKNKMNTWDLSGEVFQVAKPKKVKAEAEVPATEEVTEAVETTETPAAE